MPLFLLSKTRIRKSDTNGLVLKVSALFLIFIATSMDSIGKVIGKPNEMLCAEQLSRRVKEELGLDNENNDTSDYTKYL